MRLVRRVEVDRQRCRARRAQAPHMFARVRLKAGGFNLVSGGATRVEGGGAVNCNHSTVSRIKKEHLRALAEYGHNNFSFCPSGAFLGQQKTQHDAGSAGKGWVIGERTTTRRSSVDKLAYQDRVILRP